VVTRTWTASSSRPGATSTTSGRSRLASRSRPPPTSSRTRSSTATSPSTRRASTGSRSASPVAGGHDFFDALDALVASVPGLEGSNGAIYANRAVQARIASSLRRLGGAQYITETLTQKNVLLYNGIPVLDPGLTAAGAAVLPLTETQGTSTAASSIYAVRFGEDETDQGVTGLTNGGVQVDDLGQLQEKPAYRTRIEFYCGLATFGGKAAARLRGVTAA
jgi:hypothetical protein